MTVDPFTLQHPLRKLDPDRRGVRRGGSARPAGQAAGRSARQRRCHLRRRLLLVHGAALRQARRRGLDHLRLHRRQKKNPTYEEVSAGGTGHAEAVQVVYDPAGVSYEKLLEVFWHNIDPTVKDRQFCDVGSQYRTAIFYTTDEQRRAAEASKAALEASSRSRSRSSPRSRPRPSSTRPRSITRTTT